MWDSQAEHVFTSPIRHLGRCEVRLFSDTLKNEGFLEEIGDKMGEKLFLKMSKIRKSEKKMLKKCVKK